VFHFYWPNLMRHPSFLQILVCVFMCVIDIHARIYVTCHSSQEYTLFHWHSSFARTQARTHSSITCVHALTHQSMTYVCVCRNSPLPSSRPRRRAPRRKKYPSSLFRSTRNGASRTRDPLLPGLSSTTRCCYE
jgi:hypothetical protein